MYAVRTVIPRDNLQRLRARWGRGGDLYADQRFYCLFLVIQFHKNLNKSLNITNMVNTSNLFRTSPISTTSQFLLLLFLSHVSFIFYCLFISFTLLISFNPRTFTHTFSKTLNIYIFLELLKCNKQINVCESNSLYRLIDLL